jgi:hypothetical protein
MMVLVQAQNVGGELISPGWQYEEECSHCKALFKESLPALVRDLFTFSSKVIKSFIIV